MQGAAPIPAVWEEMRKFACVASCLAQGRLLHGAFVLMAPGKKGLSELLAEVARLQHKRGRIHDFQAVLLAV